MAVDKGKVPIFWSLKDLDTGEIIEPQFPSEDFSISVGGQIAEQSRWGFQDPIINWTRGKSRDINFQSVLYARHEDEGEDVQELLDKIISISEIDSNLGRTHICLFTLGKVMSETVLVESVDPVINEVLINGYPRKVTLSLSLKRYTPFTQSQIDPSKPVKESFYLVASAAERSYEAIAKRYYGNALYGDRLRKRHPDMPLAPTIGSVVKIPSRSVILTETIEPESHVLSLTDSDAVENYETILEARNKRKLYW